jgi:hypothetical protein
MKVNRDNKCGHYYCSTCLLVRDHTKKKKLNRRQKTQRRRDALLDNPNGDRIIQTFAQLMREHEDQVVSLRSKLKRYRQSITQETSI